MADDAARVHREWLGYLQPIGLLFSPAALTQRGVLPDTNVGALQEQLDAFSRRDIDTPPTVADFSSFAQAFLGWRASDLAGAPDGPALPESLEANLVEYEERLAPTFAVPAEDGSGGWQMLVVIEEPHIQLDAPREDDGTLWPASAHARCERLLREVNIPVGLLTNGRVFRLIYAPKGETSGFGTFDLAAMLETAGRPMLAAFVMLFSAERFFGIAEQRLVALLAESRLYQAEVSKALSRQVLVALNELLRGIADATATRELIARLAADDPDHLYGGLLSALLRLIFTLYAEDRGLFPQDDIWQANYSLGGLYLRLRGDASTYPDTMDDRFGAWAQILVLWRLIHGGGTYGAIKLTARRGHLFDPDRFPFLEGREDRNATVRVPAVSDGVVWRVLQSLMVLDGERLSYRTLDVEQIGSVYQSTMGFTVETTRGTASVAIKPQKNTGAAATIALDDLLAEPAAKRKAWLKERTDRDVTPKVDTALKAATTREMLEAALSSVIDTRITPKPLPEGVPVLQPTEARRKSGSHYTPRTLTAPIVAETLRPQLERLGPDATAERILDLRVLDPALGSGAFLVETCRQLADQLTAAWERHGSMPPLPADEDALLHARRLIAQRCLYGVDRNAMAADLAKLSLWLTTLAKDHEFTFLDHAIRHGDALVGLSLEQLERLNWDTSDVSQRFGTENIRAAINAAIEGRRTIREAADDVPEATLAELLVRVDAAVEQARLIADALLAAFFANAKSKERHRERQPIVSFLMYPDPTAALRAYLARSGAGLAPFHWELEYPEVFERENPGFDVIVGNPPYAGKNTIAAGNPPNYIAWIKELHEDAHGNADLVAHFFRRAFGLLREGGTMGFVATNTIRQGDTRASGLRWIRNAGGMIYNATQRYSWPGEAAVVVCVIHISKGTTSGDAILDGRAVAQITAFLFDQGTDENPYSLRANDDCSFIGSYPLGMGFTFDDTDKKGVASSIAAMHDLIARDPCNAEIIKPFIGGEEVLKDPLHRNHRYIMNFGNVGYEEATRWQSLLDIVRERVKPIREADPVKAFREQWWTFARVRSELYRAIKTHSQVLVTAQTAANFAPTFIANGSIYDQTLIVFALQSSAAFGVLQSLPHDIWAAFFGPTMKDDRRYAPSDAFQTFPFPRQWARDDDVQQSAFELFEKRREIMAAQNEGLTKTYNRFHDERDNGASTLALRRLHAKLDRAVLNAYGWHDIPEHRSFERAWIDESGKEFVRYTWPTNSHDTVLARLLELNAERHAEELRGDFRSLLVDDHEAFERESRDASRVQTDSSASEDVVEAAPQHLKATQ
jgi:hypothetical protein